MKERPKAIRLAARLAHVVNTARPVAVATVFDLLTSLTGGLLLCF
jgi:hypothetical protein